MQTRPVPSVSVVMPAYNAEKYLREAIDSILAQTYKDFEFIIINDGSTDRTKEIILSYSDPRIVYLENEENSGICVTLNKGLDAARGRYIARMDADDIALPDRFALQVDFLDSHPKIGVVGSYLQIMDEKGVKKYIFENSPDPDECYINMIFATSVGHPSVLIRKSCLKDNNLEYEEYFRGMEDFFLWWQIAKHAQISNIPKPLLNYRCHGNQVTKNQINNDFLKRQKEFFEIRMADMGVNLTKYEMDVMNQYLVDCGKFTDSTLTEFIATLQSLYKQVKTMRPQYKTKLKLYAAKAISLAMDRSINNLRRSRPYYTNMSLAKGCMPFTWWLKRMYHYIFR